MKTIGPNYFLATVAQESQFATNASVSKSGFYQLDFMPRDIAWDATTVASGPDFPSYLEFLMHADRDNVINALTLKGFCSSSIIAGYYSVMTLKALKKNTAPVTDLPLFGINYCKNTLNNLSLDLTANVPASSRRMSTSTDSYSYTADTIMMGMLAVFYNRGRSDAAGINFVSTCSNGATPFTGKFIYNKDDESAAGYTGRYIYQIQTAYNSLLANGNASAANIFQPTISFADVQAHINNLDLLYTQDVRQVGITTANALMGSTSYSYSSPDFYNIFSQVVTNMIERSKKRWQPVQATLAISGASVTADMMPLLDVYSGSYSGLSFDGSGNITDTPVDSVAMCTGGGGIYYIGFTVNGPHTLVPRKIPGYHYTVPCYADYTADLTVTWQDAVNLNATLAAE